MAIGISTARSLTTMSLSKLCLTKPENRDTGELRNMSEYITSREYLGIRGGTQMSFCFFLLWNINIILTDECLHLQWQF